MITVNVGDKEKHVVSFSYDSMWGKTEILVDGKQHSSTRIMLIGKTPFEFQVGDKEKHKVKIELHNPLGFAFRGSNVTVFVDGEEVRKDHINSKVAILILFLFMIMIAGVIFSILL